MKNFISIILLNAVLVFFMGCKKGDEDPFLSLKSRKARLTGEWTINSWNYTRINNFSSNTTSVSSNQGTTYVYTANYTSSQTYTLNIENTNFTIIDNSFNESVPNGGNSSYSESKKKNGTASGTATIEFIKDGTFTRKIEYSNANFNINSTIINAGNNSAANTSSVESSVETTTGTWEFLGGIENEYKNKERIILHIKSIKTEKKLSDNSGYQGLSSEYNEYKDADNNEIWLLIALKNNEVIFEAESSYHSNNSDSDSMNSSSGNSNQTIKESNSSVGTFNGSLSK